MLIQIKANAATRHAQFVLVSYYPLSALLGKPTGSSGFIAPRNRNLDQPAENRLATLNASIRKRMHEQDQIYLYFEYHLSQIKRLKQEFLHLHACSPDRFDLGPFVWGIS